MKFGPDLADDKIQAVLDHLNFIFMRDRWKPENAIDGRYIWLPVQFNKDGLPFLEWKDLWSLEFSHNQRTQ